MKEIHQYSNIIRERIKNKKRKGMSKVEKMIYSRDDLIFLIFKRQLIANEIKELRNQLNEAIRKQSISDSAIQKREHNLQQLETKKKNLFNISKLRRTVIHGIPCKFVEFDKDNIDITAEKIYEHN